MLKLFNIYFWCRLITIKNITLTSQVGAVSPTVLNAVIRRCHPMGSHDFGPLAASVNGRVAAGHTRWYNSGDLVWTWPLETTSEVIYVFHENLQGVHQDAVDCFLTICFQRYQHNGDANTGTVMYRVVLCPVALWRVFGRYVLWITCWYSI